MEGSIPYTRKQVVLHDKLKLVLDKWLKFENLDWTCPIFPEFETEKLRL